MRQQAKTPPTNRHQRLNRVIAVAALVLLVLIAGITWKALHDSNPDARITLADVEEIRIERIDQPTMVLRASGDGNGWRIEQPWSLPANTQRVEPLLSALAMGGEGYAPEEVDIDATGLANPAVTLQIDHTRVEIGEPDVTGTRRYARRDGRIVLIDDWMAALIDGGVTAMARLTPFDGTLTDMKASFFPAVTLDDWQALSARQIVAWPIEDDAEVQWRTTIDTTLSDHGSHAYELVQTARYTALHPAGTGFAYLFANEDWPSRTP